MKKEDLINYKEKLSKLSEEEKKLRDLELRKIALGEIQGPITGYPSIDKPWLKYYSEDAILKDTPKCTIYEMIYNNNKSHLDNNAIQYFDKYISYGELFERIEEAAKALKTNGIQEGDIINVSLPNIPESSFIIYALSKIGAIANMIDPRSSANDFKHYINEVDSKYLFVLDDIMPKIDSIIKETPIKKIVSISAINSLKSFDATLENKDDVVVCNYNSFIDSLSSPKYVIRSATLIYLLVL